MRPDGPRDRLAGPSGGPIPPFPIKLRGPVIKGFGRGSSELGIPTANIPPEGLSAYPDLKTGIYFGYCTLQPPNSDVKSASNPDEQTNIDTSHHNRENIQHKSAPQIYRAVLSIGYNPYYGNTTRSIEIHILHSFPSDFYGSSLNLLMLGFIRPEYDYVSKESLIEDIMEDCEVTKRSLGRENWREESTEEWGQWLGDFSWAEGIGEGDVRRVEDETLGRKVVAEGEVGRL